MILMSDIILCDGTFKLIFRSCYLWVSDQSQAEATYGHISNWDVSLITDMSYLFEWSTFNDDISSWDQVIVNTEFNQNI